MASVWSWAIVVEKFFAFRRAQRETDKFEQLFWSGQSLDELYNALARGQMARFIVGTNSVRIHLKGAAKAINTMRRACPR